MDEKLTCVICFELFKSPVTIQCGHSFCMGCLSEHWDTQKRGNKNAPGSVDCPICKEEFVQCPELRKNVTLSEIAEDRRFAVSHSATVREPDPIKGKKCHQHGWALQLYCRTEKKCICCICTTKECKNHNRVLLDEEKKIAESNLTENIAETTKQIEVTEKEIEKLLEQVDSIKVSAGRIKDGILNKFAQLTKATEKSKQEVIEFIESEERNALTQAEGNKKQLQQRHDVLKGNKLQMENLLKSTDDIEVLQEWPLLNMPYRNETLPSVNFQMDSKLSEITRVLSEVSRLVLEDLLPASLTVDCSNTKTQDYCNLTFDENTAHKHLHLSKENTRAKHDSSKSQHYCEHPDRFQYSWQVLCREALSQGKHYWEAQCSDEWSYLGVVYEEINRKEKGKSCLIGMNNASWGLYLLKDRQSAWHDGKEIKLKTTCNYNRIGVYLDYPAGLLSFYAIGEEMKHIYSFYCVFTKPLYPAFWIGEDVTITLCQL
ncbi:E3 ubiquitin-protein ligase TRIM65 isoform X2 [Latimeria chalumnae]|uniref:E3 ubiquitin-protein ligase TRIM65 isoform X2 n=1 Tax=Latimeria chalumnae TaxID=7897 RepID=UPI00313DC912